MEIKKLDEAITKDATYIGGNAEIGIYKFTGMSAEEIIVVKKGREAKGTTAAIPDQKFVLLELSGQCEKQGVAIGLQRMSIPYIKGWAEATDANAFVTVEVYHALNSDGSPKLSPSGYPVLRTRVLSVEQPA